MLEVEGLSHRYRGASAPALADVSLSAQRGSVLGLLGPNGAGKTTLISHLSGAVAIQHGAIRIDGAPLVQVRRETPTRIAVAPQEWAFYPMLSVAENLACFAGAGRLSGARKRERIAWCLQFAQLDRFVDTRAERLSGGLKRRLNLAIALLPEPQLILFDEPTVGVDPQSRVFVLQAIRALADNGAAVIYASHYMEEIEAIADRVLILDHGRVLRDGALEDLLEEGESVLSLRAPGVEAATLARFGDVEPWRGGWRIRLADGEHPAQVLAAIEAAGVQVQQAEFGRRDLEQVFMALTHRSLRDGAA